MAGEVKVVPLEWRKHNVDGTHWDAPSISGDYVVKFDGKDWVAIKGMARLMTANTCRGAMSGAQAIHEDAVRSCIAPTDEDPTTLDAQAEARLSLRDTFIAEKGLWSEFAETVLHQQSSLEASGE